MTHGLFVGTKRITKFYSRAFTTCQWLLASTKRTTGFTRKYLPQLLLMSTKMHDRSYTWVFSTRQLSLASSVLLMLHEPNTWVIFKISWGTKHYSCFFVNLDVSCTVACPLIFIPSTSYLTKAILKSCNYITTRSLSAIWYHLLLTTRMSETWDETMKA